MVVNPTNDSTPSTTDTITTNNNLPTEETMFAQTLLQNSIQQQQLLLAQQHEETMLNNMQTIKIDASTDTNEPLPLPIVKPRTVDANWAIQHPYEIEKMIQESMVPIRIWISIIMLFPPKYLYR